MTGDSIFTTMFYRYNVRIEIKGLNDFSRIFTGDPQNRCKYVCFVGSGEKFLLKTGASPDPVKLQYLFNKTIVPQETVNKIGAALKNKLSNNADETMILNFTGMSSFGINNFIRDLVRAPKLDRDSLIKQGILIIARREQREKINAHNYLEAPIHEDGRQEADLTPTGMRSALQDLLSWEGVMSISEKRFLSGIIQAILTENSVSLAKNLTLLISMKNTDMGSKEKIINAAKSMTAILKGYADGRFPVSWGAWKSVLAEKNR